MAEQAHVRGKVVTFALDKLKPNGWNPNVVTPEKMASIEYGFRTDGWLASQALLVWRKDDKGKVQNVIIDGEHRWKAARTVGLTEGPVVFLDGVSEVDAKSLTIKLNQKRGEWDEDALGKLLREVQGSSEDLGLDFGFGDDELDRLLAETHAEAHEAAIPPVTPDVIPAPAEVGEHGHKPAVAAPAAILPAQAHIQLVQLFFTKEQRGAFDEMTKAFAERFGTKTITETVLAVYRCANGAEDPATFAGR